MSDESNTLWSHELAHLLLRSENMPVRFCVDTMGAHRHLSLARVMIHPKGELAPHAENEQEGVLILVKL